MEIIILDGKCMRDFESAHDYLSRVLKRKHYGQTHKYRK